MNYVTLLKRTLVMTTHTRSELPCCVERPGVEWPVAPVLRLGEVSDIVYSSIFYTFFSNFQVKRVFTFFKSSLKPYYYSGTCLQVL